MDKLSFTGYTKYYNNSTIPYQLQEQDIEQYGNMECKVDWNNQKSIDDFIKSLDKELWEFERKRRKTFMI